MKCINCGSTDWVQPDNKLCRKCRLDIFFPPIEDKEEEELDGGELIANGEDY